MRVSQVAFSADEDFLVLSAETGGGLAVYEVQALIQGNTQSTFQLPTNGAALRALVPNPTPETAELFAAVTTNGELLMANLKTRQFLNGSQGQVLKDGVSCVSWSTQGKQLVVGLGNGTLCQMTPKGEMKGEIPRPPALEGDQHGECSVPRTLVAPLISISVFYIVARKQYLSRRSYAVIIRSRPGPCDNLPCSNSPSIKSISHDVPKAPRALPAFWDEQVTSFPIHAASKKLPTKHFRCHSRGFYCLCRYWLGHQI